MKGKAIIPLILGLCVGLVAVKFLVDAIQKARGSTTGQETISVVRARVDIDSYQKITEEHVEIVETTDATLAPSLQRLSTLEEVIGRVTAKAIPQHAPVLKTMLAPEGTLPGMRGLVKEGFRAVSVRIDEVTGVAYQLRPGDWVDVIVVMDVDTGGGRGRRETVAEVILERVQIAAIGQATSGAATQQGGSRVKPAKSATLLVRVEDAPKLHLAATRGKLTLTMRGEDDMNLGSPTIAHSTDVFGSGKRPKKDPPQEVVTARPVRRPAPEPKHGVTLYTGSGKGTTEINQTIFASSDSRVIVGVSKGIISKTDASNEHDRNRSKSNRRPPSDAERDRRGSAKVQSSNPETYSEIEETE